MDHREIEELLYTDMELRHATEAVQQSRFHAERRRKHAFVATVPAENFDADGRRHGEEKGVWPELGPKIQWPVLTRDSFPDEVKALRS